MNGKALRLASSALCFVIACPAFAEDKAASEEQASNTNDEGQQIVVTATRRSTDLQSTPLSVSAVSGDYLEESGLNSVSDAIALVPGVSLTNGQPGRSDLTVRGVNTSSSSVSLTDVIVNSTTAVYLDQLPVTSTVAKTPDFRFVDMNRIEVLRGPQGTLYGQSAMGGVIKYVPNAPDPAAFEGGGSAYLSTTKDGGTNYGFDGFVNVPITDNLAVRAVGYLYENDGFIDTVYPQPVENSNAEHTIGGRFAVHWQPSSNFSLDLGYLYHEVELDNLQAITSTYDVQGNPAFFSLPQNFMDVSTSRLVAQHVQPAYLQSQIFHMQAELELDTIVATLIAGRKLTETSNIFEAAELTGGTESYFGNATISDADSNTFEFRLVSNLDNSPVEWLAGVYYEDSGGQIGAFAQVAGVQRELIPGIFVLPVGLVVLDSGRQLNYEELAFYGEVALNISQAVRLTGGVRYSDVSNNYKWTYADGFFDPFVGRTALIGLDQGSSEQLLTYRANLEIEPSENLLFFAQASSGYRPGGFNPGNALSTPPIADFDYQSDTLWNYEVGMRSNWADGDVTFNAIAYLIDWSDIQLPTTQLVPPFYSATVNAGTAEIKGVELEFGVRPTDILTLGAAYTYTDATLESVAAAIPGFGAIPGSPGEQLPGTAKHQFTLSASIDAPLTSGIDLVGGGLFQHVGSRTSSLGNPERMPGYEILNARIGLRFSNGLSTTLFADNLTNEIAVLRQIPGAPFRSGDVFEYLTINTPRTLGLRLGYKF